MSRIFFIIPSILAYFISLSVVCFTTMGAEEIINANMLGIALLLIGWLGFLGGGLVVPWFANLFLFAAWITYLVGEFKLSKICGVIALILALSFMLVEDVTLPSETSYIKVEKLVSYELGHWLWLTSILLILVAVIGGLGPFFRRKI